MKARAGKKRVVLELSGVRKSYGALVAGQHDQSYVGERSGQVPRPQPQSAAAELGR